MNKLCICICLILVCSCVQKLENDPSQEKFKTFIKNFTSDDKRNQVSDLSAEFYATQLKDTRAKIIELEAIDTNQLSFEEKIDWRFANSILKGVEIRQNMYESWKMDPRIYTQFRAIDNILGKPGDLSHKIVALEKHLKLLPIQLTNGQKQLEFYVPRFQELGIFMAENARELFSKDLPEFTAKIEGANKLTSLIDNAKKALESYIEFLKDELPKKPEGNFAMGAETYNQILKEQFLLDYTDQTLWEFGKQKFDATVSELEDLAQEIDPSKTWQELVVEIKNEYPEPHQMIAAHQLWVDSAKSHILRNKLIPIPWKERVQVVPRPNILEKPHIMAIFPGPAVKIPTVFLRPNG